MRIKTDGARTRGPATPRSRTRNWIFKSIAACLALLVALAIFEIALRIAWRTPRLPAPPGLMRNDPRIGPVHVPGFHGVVNTAYHRKTFVINSKGLRDVERDYRASDGTYRILALGDSYVAGYGVEFEQAFLRRAEKLLQPPAGYSAVEIIKAGVGGWGPMNEWFYLKEEGWKYEPDLVLVVFYTGNDFSEAEEPFYLTVLHGIPLGRPQAQTLTPFRAARIFLRKHFYVYCLITDAAKGLMLSDARRYDEDIAVVRASQPNGRIPTSGVREAIDQISDWCADHETPLRFVILPHRTQIESERAKRIADEFGFHWDSTDLDRLTKTIRAVLDDRSMPYFDFTASLKALSAAGKEISYGGDSHYRPEVHEELGRRLAEYLEATSTP